MIPEWNQTGVLPPFDTNKGPTDSVGLSPYRTTITEFVLHYALSQERIAILKGLINYRKRLRDVGITQGFQWIDGSFVENIEKTKNRAPADIDLVTFGFRPSSNYDDWKKVVISNEELFLPSKSKAEFLCDAYYVDLEIDPIQVVNRTRYWFGLFSHQRESLIWKGMIEIPIQCSDEEALVILNQEITSA